MDSVKSRDRGAGTQPRYMKQNMSLISKVYPIFDRDLFLMG